MAFCNLDPNCSAIYRDKNSKDFRQFPLPNCSLILKGPETTKVYRKGENFKLKRGIEGKNNSNTTICHEKKNLFFQ